MTFLCRIMFPLVVVTAAVGWAAELPDVVGDLPDVESFDHAEIAIDVFVRDAEGRAVTGLAVSDFRLGVDGADVGIEKFAAFTERSFDASGASSVAVDEGAARPQPTYIILYIDHRYLRFSDRNDVLRAMRGFVRETVGGPVQMMVVSFDGAVEIVQTFTDDARTINDVLREMRMEESGLEDWDDEHDRVQREIRRTAKNKNKSRAGRYRTLSDLFDNIREHAEEEDRRLTQSMNAIRETGNALTGISGRKYLIYVSNGLPLVLSKDLMHEFAGLDDRSTMAALTMPYNRKRHFDALAAQANAQEITVYTIDATGTKKESVKIGDSDSVRAVSAPVIARENNQASLRLLAEKTGGLAVVETDDFTAALDRIRIDLQTYYSIGYDLATGDSDTVHHIEIGLSGGDDYEVRYRPTYVEKSVQSRVQDEVAGALFFEVGDNPMDLRIVAGEQVRATETRWMQPLTVLFPASKLRMIAEGDDYAGRVVLYVAIRDREGRDTDLQRQAHDFRLPRNDYAAHRDDDFQIHQRLLIGPGEHTVVIGLLDENSRQTSFVRFDVETPGLD